MRYKYKVKKKVCAPVAALDPLFNRREPRHFLAQEPRSRSTVPLKFDVAKIFYCTLVVVDQVFHCEKHTVFSIKKKIIIKFKKKK